VGGGRIQSHRGPGEGFKIHQELSLNTGSAGIVVLQTTYALKSPQFKMNPSTIAAEQYLATTDKLTARIRIHSYSTNPQSWFSWLKERIIVEGDVLEVGAGTGELWKHIDHTNARLTLTDFSPTMCATLSALNIPNTIIKQCDAANLPFPDHKFDIVIANHMLYHVNDPDAVLAEFARVLRPGGRLIVSLSGRNDNEELTALSATVGRPSMVLKHARIVAETGPDFLARYFVDIKSENFPGNLSVPIPEPILSYLNSLGNEELTAEQTSTARSIIEERIAAEGSFKVSKLVYLLTARRQ
jgi:ubiquinone/menaquinone biosynthesis C-methylase UbiE